MHACSSSSCLCLATASCPNDIFPKLLSSLSYNTNHTIVPLMVSKSVIFDASFIIFFLFLLLVPRDEQTNSENLYYYTWRFALIGTKTACTVVPRQKHFKMGKKHCFQSTFEIFFFICSLCFFCSSLNHLRFTSRDFFIDLSSHFQ